MVTALLSAPVRSALWRWHGIAGLLVAPFLLLLAVTGAVYLFRWEVDRWQHPALFAPIGEVQTTYARQLAAVEQDFPGSVALSVALDPDHAWPTEVLIRDLAGVERTVLVDPASATVRGSITDAERLTALAIHLHRDLFAGTPGRCILELAASWALILVLTGVVLWWPAAGHCLRALWGAGRRRDLRWWHVTPAVVLAPAMLLLVLSGLPWTVVWGRLYDDITTALGSGFPSEVFWQRPRSDLPAPPHPLTIDAVLHAVADRPFPAARTIELPRTIGESWVVHGQMGREPLRARWSFVDPHDGRILYDRSWADIGTLARPATVGVALHMGLLFGPLNRLLSLLGCLGMATAALTGPVLWWTRRRRNEHLPAASDITPPWWLWVVAGVVLILLPVAAAGTAIVAAWAWAWRSWSGGGQQ